MFALKSRPVLGSVRHHNPQRRKLVSVEEYSGILQLKKVEAMGASLQWPVKSTSEGCIVTVN